MNDSFGGGGFNANTSTLGGQGEQSNKDGVLPVVIRQLLMVDESLEMFGKSYALIDIVALIRGVEFSATKITYHLEDHTGQIDAFFWLEGDDQINQPQLTTNCYARIVGSLRTSGEAKVIIVYHAEEVTDPNVMTTHRLEVLYVRFKAESYKKRGSARPFPSGIEMENYSQQAAAHNVDDAAQKDNPFSLPPKQLLIYKAVRDGGGTSGLHRRELERKFPHIKADELSAALEFMVTEGIIYTTVDVDHYLTVD